MGAGSVPSRCHHDSDHTLEQEGAMSKLSTGPPLAGQEEEHWVQVNWITTTTPSRELSPFCNIKIWSLLCDWRSSYTAEAWLGAHIIHHYSVLRREVALLLPSDFLHITEEAFTVGFDHSHGQDGGHAV